MRNAFLLAFLLAIGVVLQTPVRGFAAATNATNIAQPSNNPGSAPGPTIKFSEAIQAFGLLFSLFSIFLAVKAYRISRRTAILTSNESITKSFDTMCQMALGNEGMLKTLDGVFFPDFKDQHIDQIKKRWGTYLVLNTIERTFFAYRTNAIDAKTAIPILEQMLDRLLSDFAAQEAFKSGSYDKDFIAYVSQRTGIIHPILGEAPQGSKL